MQLVPPEVAATWPAPNYVDPVSRGPALITVELVTLSLALICLSLRLYVKTFVLRKPNWDDLFMVLATIFGTGVTVTVILANTRYGWNHHIWDLKLTDLITARKVSFAAQMLYLFSTALAKISILLSYTSLAVPGTPLDVVSKVTIGLIGAGQGSFLIVLLTQCIPTSSYWNLARINEDCSVREGSFLMAQAVFTVLSDLAVWVLPLPTFYYARLPLGQRVALIVLFSFGAVVVVAACLRTYWLWWAVGETWDVTWDAYDEWIWTAVEVHVGITCGCVPWLKSLVGFWRGKHHGSSRSRSAAAAAASRTRTPSAWTGGESARSKALRRQESASPMVELKETERGRLSDGDTNINMHPYEGV
ncbi:hypothetical protein B0H63DRAFT_121690 [Podospora didyma]|uniref:Rhodopsin domain-containing protein n=1 Tax=Podospora didyma TaxID=330526 RepID=A0AAE0U4G9_9PEZI|nr:hypothetical protein B0H63DRAFT_121690 [Podospora didyma]